MDKKFFVLNILMTVMDAILDGLAICAFAWGAIHFERWWILTFAIVPLALFSSHSIIIDSDIQQAELDKLSPQKGDDNHGIKS